MEDTKLITDNLMDLCPDSDDKKHEPDWDSINLQSDGGTWYVDVNCKHCGRSGCVGSSQMLASKINW